MTKLLRRVTRETLQLHGGRPLMVSLVPEGCFEIVAESTPSIVYRLGWEDAIKAATSNERYRAERARERRVR